MKALILAAGMGTRISKHTNGKPKCLLEVNGSTIIERQIKILNNVGVPKKDIIIVTGYKSNFIKDLIGNEVKYIHNVNFENTSSLYSMWLAKNEDYSNGMLLFNSDLIFHEQILYKLVGQKGNAIAVDFNKNIKDGEMNVVIDKKNNIIEISKEIDETLAHGESVQICKFDKSSSSIIFENVDQIVKENPSNSLFPAYAFKDVIDKKGIFALDIGNYSWGEIDYLVDLEEVKQNNWS